MFWTGFSYGQVMAVFTVVLTTYTVHMIWIRRKYPPGPWPLPFIGNLHLLLGNVHIDLKDLSNKYGPIYTVWLAWSPMVMVCSRALGKEVLLSKGKEFGGRAMDSYTLSLITHGNEDIITGTYDEKLKLLRRVGFSFMKAETKHGVSVQGIIESEADEFLANLKQMEEVAFDPSRIVTWSNSNILMQICVNKRFKSVNDPEFIKWTGALSSLDETLQGVFDFFPNIAGILPWTRKVAKDISLNVDQFLGSIVSEHESMYEDGKIRNLLDVLTKTHSQLPHDSTSSVQLTKTDYVLFLLDFLMGGAGLHLLWAIAVLLRRADIARKIQRELDTYVSTKRKDENEEDTGARGLITLCDRPNLPYLNAFIYEVLRRCAIIPVTIPHKALTDTSISKYRIPKYTAVVVNLYAINMNPEDWEEPELFKPERFLDAKGELDSNLPKNLITFGAGPRNCLGQNVVKMEMFIYLANLLLNYKLSCPSVGSVPSFEEGTLGTVFYPKPFSMIITERRQ